MPRRSRKPAAGAIAADLPAHLAPELPRLVTAPPARGDWRWEFKLDGYRFMSRLERSTVRLNTKGGHDWTARLPVLAAELQGLDLGPAWLDGEVVALDERRHMPNFDLIQYAFDKRRTGDLVFYLFDMPYMDGWDLRAVPLEERRNLLALRLGAGSAHVRYSETLDALPPDDLLWGACDIGMEGIVGKLAASPYTSGRNGDWVKLRCPRRSVFLVGGCVLSAGSGRIPTLAALLLGQREDDDLLRFAGRVGVGISERTGREMLAQLLTKRRQTMPFDIYETERAWGRRQEGETIWVKPEFMISVAYTEITARGHVRHASARGSKLLRPPKRSR